MSYVTQSELERELPFDAADFRIDDETTDADGNTEWDNLLTDILERESDRVDGWINQPGNETAFSQTTATAELSGSDGKDLPLPKRPVQSVQSLEVDGQVVDSSDYWVEETHLRLKPDADTRYFPSDHRSVNVEWTYGYDSVPSGVKAGVIRLARNALEQIETDGLESESVGDESYSYRPPADLREEVRSEVVEYRPDSYYGGSQVV